MSFGTQWRFEESFDVENFLKHSKDGAPEVRRELFGAEVKRIRKIRWKANVIKMLRIADVFSQSTLLFLIVNTTRRNPVKRKKKPMFVFF